MLIVVALVGAAILTKEQAVALPALFLLTDLWWNTDGAVRALDRPSADIER